MKVTREQLQKYFVEPLPSVEEIADAFTFHAFEIDSIENGVLDVKVLPNRTADCNSEEGLACELSAILNLPLQNSAEPEYTEEPVSLTLAKINGILGTQFSQAEVADVFRRLRFRVQYQGDVMQVTAPVPRTDICIPEDVIEEVGQILGYERVPNQELPPAKTPADQNRYRGIERMKDMLVEQGFTEISTQSFAPQGDVYLANPMDKTKPALRTSLEAGIADALLRAKQYAPLVLPSNAKPKLFEVGTVFPKNGEYVELRMSEKVKEWGTPEVDNLSIAKLEDYGKEYEPKRYELGAYHPFSIYPFIQRDVALWVPASTSEADVLALIREKAGALCVRISQFDRFEKEGRISLAFRLIFQSRERTLQDAEVNTAMEQVYAALKEKGFEIR